MTDSNPQTDRGVANKRSGKNLRRKCKCGRTITGNAAWWSHQNANVDSDEHGYAGRGSW